MATTTAIAPRATAQRRRLGPAGASTGVTGAARLAGSAGTNSSDGAASDGWVAGVGVTVVGSHGSVCWSVIGRSPQLRIESSAAGQGAHGGPPTASPGELLHDLLHLGELLHETIDVGKGGPGAGRDAASPGRVEHSGIAALDRGHRPDDRLG